MHLKPMLCHILTIGLSWRGISRKLYVYVSWPIVYKVKLRNDIRGNGSKAICRSSFMSDKVRDVVTVTPLCVRPSYYLPRCIYMYSTPDISFLANAHSSRTTSVRKSECLDFLCRKSRQ